MTSAERASPRWSKVGGVDARAVGARIRKLRRDQGMTQAQLGGRRLSESYVSLIESGRRTPPEDVLAYLADELGCTVEVLRGDEEGPDAAQAELVIRRGEWETSSGQVANAIAHLEQGLALAAALGLPVLVSRARVSLAKALEADGRLREAIGIWEEVLSQGAMDPRNTPWAAATVGLSRCCREVGDLERAIEVGETFWRDQMRVAAGPEDRVLVGATLLGAYLEIGDQERCHELARELVELAERADTPKATGAAYWQAALAAEAEGRVADALRLAEKAQAEFAQTEDVRNRARLQTALAGLHLRMNPPEVQEALRLLHAAQPVLQQFASPIDVCYCQTELARAHLGIHEFGQAISIATSTIADLDKSGEARIEKARTLMVRALAHSAIGEREQASADALDAAVLLEDLGAGRQAASIWTELAELYVELGDSGGAIDAFRRATLLLGAKRTPGHTEGQAIPVKGSSAQAS
jgi:tetratricopeptide (TPR) repeat protein